MDGIIVLDKPAGFTSFDCVAVMRRLTGERKIGHTGTLDPQATGVLPLCIGKATRLLEYMDAPAKRYVCGCTLGIRTDSMDVWGKVLSDERPLAEPAEKEAVREALLSFAGEIVQTPPAFSAVKVNGRRLYSYAREGKAVEIPERRVTVHGIELLEWPEGASFGACGFVFELSCSRGTYVRSICSQLGEMLGCGAAMSSLVRTCAAGFDISEAIGLGELRSMSREQIEALLLPCESAVRGLKRLELDSERARLFASGNPLWSEGLEGLSCLPAVCDGSGASPVSPVFAVFSEGTLLGTASGGKISKVLA